MNKNFLTTIFLALGSLAFSQNYLKAENVKIKELDQNGGVKFVAFKPTANISSGEANLVLKEALDLNNQNNLIIAKTKTDENGGLHVFYKQYFNGVEVEGNGFVVHSKDGKITAINGTYNNVTLNLTPEQLKSDEQVLQMGTVNLAPGYLTEVSQIPADIRAKYSFLNEAEIEGKLTILPKTLTSNADRYAYTYNLVNNQTGEFNKVYIDALDGNILKEVPILKFLENTSEMKYSALTQEQFNYLEDYAWSRPVLDLTAPVNLVEGTGETHYSGVQPLETMETDEGFVLEDETRFVRTRNYQGEDYLVLALLMAFGGNIDDLETDLTINFADDDNNWTTAEHEVNKNTSALDAHWAFSQTYDYFKTTFDRDGYDDQNTLVRSYVHVTFFGSPANAAFLDLVPLGGEGGIMLVGDGDYDWDSETGAYDVFSPLDVMSHEFAHGVNRAGGGLVYEKESGALDEGFADMWGAIIEGNRAPDKDKWSIGEEITINADPAGVRSFREPKLFNQPDTYNGEFYIPTEDCTPGQDNDNCGVHTNSGVPNHWFYLIAEGGNGTNDHDYAYDVTGFGIDKAAELIYAVQENYVQSQSQFSDIMNFSIQEAGVQFGENSSEVSTVKAAWCAVGVAAPDSEICSTLRINDLTGEQFSVYPNPVSDVLNINYSKSVQHLNFTITNMAGQTLQQGEIVDNKVNVSILPKGVYTLTVKGDVNKTLKFIKK